MDEERPRALRVLGENRFLALLIALGFVLTSYPLSEEGGVAARVAVRLSFDFVLVAGLLVTRGVGRWLWIWVALALPSAGFFWGAFLLEDSSLLSSRPMEVVAHFATAAYLFLLVPVILRDLFSSGVVTGDRLCGALSGYLLLGVAWGAMYTGLELLAPGSFAVGEGLPQPSEAGDGILHRSGVLYYFSFATLTTLGYGDITPLRASAQMLVMWEAIVGQAYLTIIVARLVGLHVSARGKE